jgi:hypothetical protein
MLEVLRDGEWHTRSELVAESRVLVPPGRAKRKTERNRQHKVNGAERRQRLSDSEQIRSGQQAIAYSSIKGLIAVGRIEQRGNGGRGANPEYRLARCYACGQQLRREA